MKTIILILATTFFSSHMMAQAIQPGVRTTFHAVDENGKPINEEIIEVEVTFAKTDANGNKVPVYSEKFTARTTKDGYFQREIGAQFGDLPTVTFGKYSDVDFKDPNLCVRVDFRRTEIFNGQWIVGKFNMMNPVPVAAQILDDQDDDKDPENEIQYLYKFGNIIALTDGGEIELLDDDPTNELQTLDFDETHKVLYISDGNSVDLDGLCPFTEDSQGLFTDNEIEARGFKTINGQTQVDPGKISIRYASGQDGIEMGIDEEFCAPFLTFIDCEGNTLGSFRMGPEGFKFYPAN